MAETEEFNIIVRDGTRLVGHEWVIDKPAGAVAMIHGLGEHSRRYDHVARFFNENGFSYYAIDQRGHGQSEGKRGHTPSHERMVDDVEEFLMYVRSEENNLPIFLYGHSMGGNLVSNYVLKKNVNELAGAIISTPWLKTHIVPPAWQRTMARVVSKIFPSFQQNNGLKVEWLTNDPEVNQKYADDPLVHDRISVRLYLDFVAEGDWALKSKKKVDVPMFVYHGAEDPIAKQDSSRSFADSHKVKYILWEKTKHEPHNDLRKEEVLIAVLNWVNKQIAP